MEVRFRLDNIDDIKWLKSFPKSERLNVLKQCMTLGRVILSVQPKLICSPNEFMEPFQSQIAQHLENVKSVINTSNRMAFEPVVGRFDHLCSRIDDLTNITSKSVLKGKMGEELIARGIKAVFPEIDIADMSKKEHETDFHLTIPNPKLKILLEIKTYTNTVPTSQVEKLYQDINFTGFKYAIMISTTSGIARHKNFDWEMYKDCLIVYITNSGLNGGGAVSAIQFILAVHQFKSIVLDTTGACLDSLELESFATVFAEQLERYQNHLNQYAKLKYNFSRFESAMSNGLRDLFTNILEMESESRRIVSELSQTFHQKLIPLTNGEVEIASPDTNREKILEFIDKRRKNGKNELYTRILGYADKFQLNVVIKDGEWMLLHDKKIITKTESTKHLVFLVFSIRKGEDYSFTGMEKLRSKQLLVQICKETHENIEKLLASRKKNKSNQ